MLKGLNKPLILLLLFCFFLSEYLTWSTLVLCGAGSIFIMLKVKIRKFYRTIIALGIFASYWIIYGKVIDPEVGLNFLTSVTLLKMLEKETRRDHYMIFFGLILLLSSGALFEKNLSYAGFYAVAFLTLIFDFYQDLLSRPKLKDLFISMLWVTPLTAALFILAPRMMNPLAFKSSAPEQGEVGYTPDVNLSEVDQLSSNDEVVFQAQVSQMIDQSQLYWRGNVLSYNDGWNWSGLPERNLPITQSLSTDQGVLQQIQLMGKQPYFFGLDRPTTFIYNGVRSITRGTRSLSQKSTDWVSSYEVISLPGSSGIEGAERTNNLRVMLSRQDQKWILETFSAENFNDLVSEVQNYFRKNGFRYSLSPGKSSNFRSFMQDRRIGYCSHFASSLGLILRVKGIPSRLVSGFMGGSYNEYGSYYLLTQNDAHSWVEALVDNKWQRLDPTEWVSPDRIQLGGEGYVQAFSAAGKLAALGFKFNFGWIQEMKFWFNQWDFKFYRWLDQMDYQGQMAVLSKIKVKRQWLFTIIPLFILGFALIYFWQLSRHSVGRPVSEIEQLWRAFFKKTRSRGLLLSQSSILEAEKQISELIHPDQVGLLEIFQQLTLASFKDQNNLSLSSLKKKIRKL